MKFMFSNDPEVLEIQVLMLLVDWFEKEQSLPTPVKS